MIQKDLKAGNLISKILHLFFADDLLFSTEASTKQTEVIKICLQSFSKASGRKVNYKKSQVFFSLNIAEESANAIRRTAGIPRIDSHG